jgi:hypothetical protein
MSDKKRIEKLKEYNAYLIKAIESSNILSAITLGVRANYESELQAIDSEEEKPIKPKFSAANILSWIQDGHAVPPYSQKDLLNYMISFVNHFTVLQQSEPSPVESSDVLPRDDFKLLEILTANCIKYDISFSGKETAVITKTAHEYASQRVEREVSDIDRIRET